MNQAPPGILEQILKWIESFLPSICAAGLAFGISYLMGVRDGQTHKKTIIGSIVCGLFTLAIGSSLELLGLSGNSVLLAGGCIGFYGADRLREKVISFGDKRTGGNGNADK